MVDYYVEMVSFIWKPYLHVERLRWNINPKFILFISGPITSWQIDGETVETVADFIFWTPKSL